MGACVCASGVGKSEGEDKEEEWERKTRDWEGGMLQCCDFLFFKRAVYLVLSYPD